MTALEVNEGDIIRISAANGGGYGDPRRQRRELVIEDVHNGYVDENTAQAVYGLVMASQEAVDLTAASHRQHR